MAPAGRCRHGGVVYDDAVASRLYHRTFVDTGRWQERALLMTIYRKTLSLIISSVAHEMQMKLTEMHLNELWFGPRCTEDFLKVRGGYLMTVERTTSH